MGHRSWHGRRMRLTELTQGSPVSGVPIPGDRAKNAGPFATICWRLRDTSGLFPRVRATFPARLCDIGSKAAPAVTVAGSRALT